MQMMNQNGTTGSSATQPFPAMPPQGFPQMPSMPMTGDQQQANPMMMPMMFPNMMGEQQKQPN